MIKQLKKVIKTPEFPPKKVLKWNTKILEQRRLGLHTYFQVMCHCAVYLFLPLSMPIEKNNLISFHKTKGCQDGSINSLPLLSVLNNKHKCGNIAFCPFLNVMSKIFSAFLFSICLQLFPGGLTVRGCLNV